MEHLLESAVGGAEEVADLRLRGAIDAAPACRGDRRRTGSPCRSGCARPTCAAGRGSPPARGPPSRCAPWPTTPARRARRRCGSNPPGAPWRCTPARRRSGSRSCGRRASGTQAYRVLTARHRFRHPPAPRPCGHGRGRRRRPPPWPARSAPVGQRPRAADASPTRPVIGPPIGVDPRKATAVRASSRPRMSGGLSCWVIPLPPLMNPPPPIPSGTAHSRADREVRCPRHPDPGRPEQHRAARGTSASRSCASRAVSSDPANEPMPVTDSTSPNRCPRRPTARRPAGAAPRRS